MPAPPTDAPSPPSTESAARVVTATIGVIWAAGASDAIINGTTAPTAKVPADTNAACIGCAVHHLRDAKLITRMRAEGILLGELDRDLSGEATVSSPRGIDACELVELQLRRFLQLAGLAADVGPFRIGL